MPSLSRKAPDSPGCRAAYFATCRPRRVCSLGSKAVLGVFGWSKSTLAQATNETTSAASTPCFAESIMRRLRGNGAR
jgi:hypothetical protein